MKNMNASAFLGGYEAIESIIPYIYIYAKELKKYIKSSYIDFPSTAECNAPSPGVFWNEGPDKKITDKHSKAIHFKPRKVLNMVVQITIVVQK